MTKVKCCYTGCMWNDSCCVIPYTEDHYCTKEDIELQEKERMADYGEVECLDYAEDEEKMFECFKCQAKKRGYVTLHDEIDYENFPPIEFTPEDID